jgi:hypothetical protein
MFLEAVACCSVLHSGGFAAHSSTCGTRFWHTACHLEHSISHRRRFAVPIATAMANDDTEMLQYSTFLVLDHKLTAEILTHLSERSGWHIA